MLPPRLIHVLTAWLDERVNLGEIREFVRHKVVPVHHHTVWYYFGGMTLFRSPLVQPGSESLGQAWR